MESLGGCLPASRSEGDNGGRRGGREGGEIEEVARWEGETRMAGGQGVQGREKERRGEKGPQQNRELVHRRGEGTWRRGSDS